MTFFQTSNRPGVSLVELLIFIAIISIVGAALVPLLFSSTESRMLQESMSLVEANGSQLMQVIGKSIRESDRIIDPPAGQTKKQLALQTSSGGLSPTVFGILSGALLRIQKTTSQQMSAQEVSVSNFNARNTGNGTSTGISISFTVSRTIRLSAPRQYRQTFQTFFSLYPKDVLTDCTFELVVSPACTLGGTHYRWGVSTTNDCSGSCTTTTPIQLECQ